MTSKTFIDVGLAVCGPDDFSGDTNATVYYMPGTSGWGTSFGDVPAVLWSPRPGAPGFGVRTNQFGFTINGPANLVIVVEACTNLAGPLWVPVSTNALSGGSSYFGDSGWTNYHSRLYRLRWP